MYSCSNRRVHRLLRRPPGFAVALVITALLAPVVPAVLVAPTAAADPRPAPTATVKPDRYAIGDSVMLGAKTPLKRRGFTVNAAVSRQAYSAPAMVRRKGNALPRNLVVHLGTNGTFPLATCRKIVKNAGPQRKVFLVNILVPRSWEKSNNATIRRCARSFPDGRVTVIDWNSVGRQHPSWFYSDGTHLKSAGAKAFASLIDRAVDQAS